MGADDLLGDRQPQDRFRRDLVLHQRHLHSDSLLDRWAERAPERLSVG